MTLAVVPGSFDPFTLGHLDVVRRARSIFDQVIVGVGVNAAKTPLLDGATRVRLIDESVGALPGVHARVVPGLLAAFCQQVGATAIVKGLRGAADFGGEEPMALMNRKLSGVETLFVLAEPDLGFISSSLVRDVARHGGTLKELVPGPVLEYMKRLCNPAGSSGNREDGLQ